MDELNTIDLEELADIVADKVKESNKSSFDDIVNVTSAINREIIISDISFGLGSSVDAYIRYWNKQDKGIPVEERKPIKLYIDSCGGSLSDSFTIIDSIKMSETPVYGICNGCAYSGGFFIFIACDHRIAYPHSSFLFHEGATGTQGTSGQFENYTAFYKKQLDQLKQIVIDNTNITEEEYKTIKREDIWYDAQEALDKGIVDVISEVLV